MRNSIVCWAVIAAALATAACGGISDATKQQATDLSNAITRVSTEVDAERSAYDKNVLKHPEYAGFLAFYAKRENWPNNFDVAKSKVGVAKQAYAKNVQPLLDKNDSTGEPRLNQEILKVHKLLGEARDWSKRPVNRRDFILDARKRVPELVAKSGAAIAAASPLVQGLEAVALGTKKTYPQRAADIDKRYASVQKLQQDAAAAYATTLTERNNFQAGRFADLVRLADSAKLVQDNSNKIREDTARQTREMGSLGVTYNKTLIDMKTRHFVTVDRTSWYDGADYPTLHTYKYQPVEISAADISYYDELPASLEYIARLTRGWSGDSLQLNIDQGKWNALKVQPRENWPDSNDDTAEFGLTDTAKYYHRYAIANNTGVRETDWEEVSEAYFEDHADDLGMDIESKPAGAFADETSRHAAPAGMALVGNSQYGQWKTGNDGTSFWEFYLQYRLFSALLSPVGGNPYYYRRNEWDSWNNDYRGRRSYYGEEGDREKKERYGTHGYVTGSGNRYASRIPEIRRSAERVSGPTFGGGNGRGGSSSRGGGK